MGLATFTNRFISGVMAISFLSLQDVLSSAGVFLMFAAFGNPNSHVMILFSPLP